MLVSLTLPCFIYNVCYKKKQFGIAKKTRNWYRLIYGLPPCRHLTHSEPKHRLAHPHKLFIFITDQKKLDQRIQEIFSFILRTEALLTYPVCCMSNHRQLFIRAVSINVSLLVFFLTEMSLEQVIQGSIRGDPKTLSFELYNITASYTVCISVFFWQHWVQSILEYWA